MSAAFDPSLSSLALDLYKPMYMIRRFELAVQELLVDDHYVSRFNTLSAGQEATAVGVCSALQAQDKVVQSYRSHGVLLARGADPGRLFAEILGRCSGYCGGRAGSLHVVVPSLGIIDTSAVVAGQLPVGTGSALVSWIHMDDVVTVCFFGDGAVSEGAFHEALNIAALWKLPIVYICENNGYAVSTPFPAYSPVAGVTERAGAYNIPTIQIDGNDVFTVRKATQQALDRARNGDGPTLVECHTQLLLGHYANSTTRRSPQDLLPWSESDPIYRLRRELVLLELEREVQAIEEDIGRQLEEAIAFALKSPYPSPLPDPIPYMESNPDHV